MNNLIQVVKTPKSPQNQRHDKPYDINMLEPFLSSGQLAP
jgi:hypothetical protein